MTKTHDVVNICSNRPANVKKILTQLDRLYGKPRIQNQKRLSIEVFKTHGSNSKIKKMIKFSSFTSLDTGIINLTNWAKKYLSKI